MSIEPIQLGSVEGQLNTAAQAAYLELLLTMLPERRHTVSGQRLLAQLRDAIARCTGNSPEAIQSVFEDRVRSIQSEPRLVLAELASQTAGAAS
jgi:hypothetical protein